MMIMTEKWLLLSSRSLRLILSVAGGGGSHGGGRKGQLVALKHSTKNLKSVRRRGRIFICIFSRL